MTAMRVKICGITSVADARLAQDAGASAIGLIFAPGSKRLVAPEVAADIVAATGPFLQRVGVFRNQPLEQVLEIAGGLKLEAVQLHGAEDQAFVSRVARNHSVIKALAFHEGLLRAQLASWQAAGILLDAPVPGSGTTFDWQAAASLAGYPGLILAGGLTPLNVASAIRAFRPYAVDVATGVEATPGVKSPSLVRSFMAAVRAAEPVSTSGDVY